MGRLKYYLGMAKGFARLGFGTMVAYPLNTLIWSVSLIVREISAFTGVILIAKMFGGMGGFTMYEICILFGMMMIPEAIGQICVDNVWNIGMSVRIGVMDTYLVRPLPVLFHLVGAWCAYQAVITLFCGLGIVIYGMVMAGIAFTPARVLFLVWFMITGTVTNSSIYLAFNSLYFWFINGEAVAELVLNFRQIAKYPLHIFPKAVRFGLTCIIPFAFAGYYPMLYLVGRGSRWTPLWMTVVALVTAAAGITVWSAGLRAYESTGT